MNVLTITCELLLYSVEPFGLIIRLYYSATLVHEATEMWKPDD